MTVDRRLPLSSEQENFLYNSIARINICDGPVRAGKNYVENLRIKTYLKTEPYGYQSSLFVFAGVSRDAVVRNYLTDLFALIGPKRYSYNRATGMGFMFGRPFFVAGFDDASAFRKIQGATIGGMLINEAQLAPENFVKVAVARCSIPDSQLFFDCNPLGPNHWLYQGYIGGKEGLAKRARGTVRHFQFTFDSNPSNTEQYKADLRADYVPGSLLYQRMIEGKWTAADGIIYTAFGDKNIIRVQDIPRGGQVWVPYDFGIQHPTVFGRFVKIGLKYYLTAEYFHHGEIEGRKTNGDYIADLRDFIAPIEKQYGRRPTFIKDPAPVAAAFNVELDRDFRSYTRVMAENEILKGIGTVQRLLGSDDLLIADCCTHTIENFGTYVWDKKAAARGEDLPLKIADDAMCMLRYGAHTVAGGERVGGYGRNWG